MVIGHTWAVGFLSAHIAGFERDLRALLKVDPYAEPVEDEAQPRKPKPRDAKDIYGENWIDQSYAPATSSGLSRLRPLWSVRPVPMHSRHTIHLPSGSASNHVQPAPAQVEHRSFSGISRSLCAIG
jgi:hypothetical protein